MADLDRQGQKRGAPDFYQVLGLHPTATVEQVKAAFRRQALRYHPDKNSGSSVATEHFKLCNDAYAVLSDPPKRARYDWQRENPGVTEIARELLDDLLGNKRRRRLAGRDLHYTLELSFREAALGLTRTIRFPVPERCPDCGGNGAAPGGTRSCPNCSGKGETRERLGLLTLPRPCPRCGGQGIAVITSCPSCTGTGSLEGIREYALRLEPGVPDGTVRVVAGRGEAGRDGAANGDLHIEVRVAPDPLLRSEGPDLRLTVPVRYSMLVLGGSLEVPTLEGRARMRIPAGTPSGRVFRLAGKGLPRQSGEGRREAPKSGEGRREAPKAGRGDLLVSVEAETPVELDERALRVLKEFDEACPDSCHPRAQEFLERRGRTT
jgi:molecular chaperone DnaJ